MYYLVIFYIKFGKIVLNWILKSQNNIYNIDAKGTQRADVRMGKMIECKSSYAIKINWWKQGSDLDRVGRDYKSFFKKRCKLPVCLKISRNYLNSMVYNFHASLELVIGKFKAISSPLHSSKKQIVE